MSRSAVNADGNVVLMTSAASGVTDIEGSMRDADQLAAAVAARIGDMATNPRIEAIERATGRSWDDWLAYMASIGADQLTHHEIASALITELDGMVDNLGWWAQATAVAYEHHTGRRVPGQRPDGTFQTSVSRSTSLGMEALIGAWTEFAAADQDVLDRITGDVRVSGTTNRHTWRAKGRDGMAYVVISEPKKDGSASLVVQILGTASLEDNASAKELWTAISTRFVATIEGDAT